MKTWPLIAPVLIVLAAPVHGAERIEVPSGQVVEWVETINTAPGPEGLTIRFRFLAPEIARAAPALTGPQVYADMLYLCEKWALARLPNLGPVAQQIIISLADQEIPFGEVNPDVTQYFEAFRPEGPSCIWQMF